MKNKHKSKFDLTVAKTCGKNKLVVFYIRYTNFVIQKYIKNSEENKCTNRLTLSSHFFQ